MSARRLALSCVCVLVVGCAGSEQSSPAPTCEHAVYLETLDEAVDVLETAGPEFAAFATRTLAPVVGEEPPEVPTAEDVERLCEAAKAHLETLLEGQPGSLAVDVSGEDCDSDVLAIPDAACVDNCVVAECDCEPNTDCTCAEARDCTQLCEGVAALGVDCPPVNVTLTESGTLSAEEVQDFETGGSALLSVLVAFEVKASGIGIAGHLQSLPAERVCSEAVDALKARREAADRAARQIGSAGACQTITDALVAPE